MAELSSSLDERLPRVDGFWHMDLLDGTLHPCRSRTVNWERMASRLARFPFRCSKEYSRNNQTYRILDNPVLVNRHPNDIAVRLAASVKAPKIDFGENH